MNTNLKIAVFWLAIIGAAVGTSYYLNLHFDPKPTRTVAVGAGALMLIGGVIQFWSAMRVRLRGGGSWRGAAVFAAAMVCYGILAVTGMVLNGTAVSAVLVWAIAAAFFFGLWLSRRETARQVR